MLQKVSKPEKNLHKIFPQVFVFFSFNEIERKCVSRWKESFNIFSERSQTKTKL